MSVFFQKIKLYSSNFVKSSKPLGMERKQFDTVKNYQAFPVSAFVLPGRTKSASEEFQLPLYVSKRNKESPKKKPPT